MIPSSAGATEQIIQIPKSQHKTRFSRASGVHSPRHKNDSTEDDSKEESDQSFADATTNSDAKFEWRLCRNKNLEPTVQATRM